MNYVSVLMVAVALFATIYWYVAGRYYYVGPRVKAQLVLGGDPHAGAGVVAGKEGDILTLDRRTGEIEKVENEKAGGNESSSSGDR